MKRLLSIMTAAAVFAAACCLCPTALAAQNTDSTVYFYDQLSDTQKYFYDQLDALTADEVIEEGYSLLNSSSTDDNYIVLKLKSPETWSFTSIDATNYENAMNMNVDTQKKYTAISDDFWCALGAFTRDRQKAFYIQSTAIYKIDVNVTDKGIIFGSVHKFAVSAPSIEISFSMSDFDSFGYTANDLELLSSYQTDYLTEYKLKHSSYEWLTDAEKARAIHDDVLGMVTYKERTKTIKTAAGTDIFGVTKYTETEVCDWIYHSAVGAFKNGLGVCEAYAESFKLLCEEFGLPCVIVTSSDHEWCYIRMDDGEWYGVDCTWDDNSAEYTQYQYFLKGSAYFNAGGAHRGNMNWFSGVVYSFRYPTLSTEDYQYSAEESTSGAVSTTTQRTTVTTTIAAGTAVQTTTGIASTTQSSGQLTRDSDSTTRAAATTAGSSPAETTTASRRSLSSVDPDIVFYSGDKVLSGFAAGSTYADLLEKIKLVGSGTIVLKDSAGNTVRSSDTQLYTGMSISVIDTGYEGFRYSIAVRGDLDGSGTVTAADARLALRCSIGLDTLEGCYLTAADAERDADGKTDGKVTAADARAILRCAVGLAQL